MNTSMAIPVGSSHRRASSRTAIAATALVAILSLLVAACGRPATAQRSHGKIDAVGAENEYANVIAQIGGKYVHATAIMSNPATDPHTFESSPKVAREVSAAQLLIQNGIGYDTFINKIASASPNSKRKVINVQKLLGLPITTPNPHLWYKPTTMPRVAKAIATDLSAIQPAHSSYFHAREAAFVKSLKPWTRALAHLKATYGGSPVATTEPVADYTLQAAGLHNLTPFRFQADIMNGIDPTPQDTALEQSLLNRHKVKAFVYNQQVTDTLTESLLKLAHKNHIPVVGVYETMPVPGYDYQTWMEAEVRAIHNALAHGTSAPKL